MNTNLEIMIVNFFRPMIVRQFICLSASLPTLLRCYKKKHTHTKNRDRNVKKIEMLFALDII